MALRTFIPGTGDVLLVPIWPNAGVPTNGASGSFLGVAQKGDLLSDTTNANLYMCTASSASSITWAAFTHA
jgi:hypothetical protein